LKLALEEVYAMWKAMAGMASVVVVLAAGCLGSGRHAAESRAAVDLQRIGEDAERVLAYMEGQVNVPPELGPSYPGKSLWDGTHFEVRWQRIGRLKSQGCLAENNKGRLELRPCDGLRDATERNEAQKLLAEENKDRKTLYKRIAEGNTEGGVSVSRVEEIYVLTRLRHAAPGQVYQLPQGGADLERLRESALGKRLGGQCAPGAWVIIP